VVPLWDRDSVTEGPEGPFEHEIGEGKRASLHRVNGAGCDKGAHLWDSAQLTLRRPKMSSKPHPAQTGVWVPKTSNRLHSRHLPKVAGVRMTEDAKSGILEGPDSLEQGEFMPKFGETYGLKVEEGKPNPQP